MPSEFGAISKVYIEKPKLTDNQVTTLETLNLFCLALDAQNNLSIPSSTLKKNNFKFIFKKKIGKLTNLLY